MQKHTKIYLRHFGYGEQDFVCCEVCARRSVDIHHLTPRSLGGTDEINNLMALCRTCHETAHASKLYNDQLKNVHLNFL